VYFCVCVIVVPLLPGKTPFAVQSNNNIHVSSVTKCTSLML
jgi:hypothetical protein